MHCLPSNKRSRCVVAPHTFFFGDPTDGVWGGLKACSEVCQLRVKPLDKKSERQLVLAHRQGFLQQLATENDPSLVSVSTV
jgi:hypothetical protein